MPSYRDAYKVPAGVVPDDPPPGSVGSDRDGAMVYFGCDFWTPDKEGQAPAIVPAPTTASRQHPDRCTVCGADVPAGMTCAGCLSAPTLDGRLTSEVVRDHAREVDRQAREAAEKGPQDFAGRRYRSAAREARDPDLAGPAEPELQGRGRKVKR
jgi:hypothetical protein